MKLLSSKLVKIAGVLVAFIMLGCMELSAQAPSGNVIDYKVIPGGDTLILNRQYSDYWYGITLGMQLATYFGDLNANTFPDQPNNPFNRIINYGSAMGAGYFAGGLFEYNPKGSDWGFRFNVNFADIRNFSTEVLTVDTLNTRFEISASTYQVNFSPSVRYNSAIEGLHFTGGFNVELLTSNDGNHIQKSINSGDVKFDNNLEFKDISLGYGFNIGFGYDLFFADISKQFRTLISPFAELQYRSSYFQDNGSSWGSLIAKFGFKLKFGKDDVDYDTLFFDPTYEPPPAYFAQINQTEIVAFEFNTSYDSDFPSTWLAYIPLAKKPDEVVLAELNEVTPQNRGDETVSAASNNVVDIRNIQSPGPSPTMKKREILINTNEQKSFTYLRTSFTDLSDEIKEYLDKVAEFLKKNPTSRVLVIGHSDPSTSLAEAIRLSRLRAQKIQNYLFSLQVPRSKVTIDAKGSTVPVKPNINEEGRRTNRRVEITVLD